MLPPVRSLFYLRAMDSAFALCPDESTEPMPPAALAVARGVLRCFARNQIWMIGEVALRNHRRADLMGLDAKGQVVIVEIKVSRADLLGDGKWSEYLEFCDRFYWAVPPAFDRAPFDREHFLPARAGVIVADGYDAEIIRPASTTALAPARRKAETQRLARLAMRRFACALDPQLSLFAGSDRPRYEKS